LLRTEGELTDLRKQHKPYAEAGEKAKTSVLDAIEHLYGQDALDRAMAESLARMRGKQSPEEIAAAAARKVIEDDRKARETEAQKTKDAEVERVKAEAQAKYTGACDAIGAAAVAMLGELEETVGQKRKVYEVVGWWMEGHNGELPADPAEALRAYEKQLRADIEARGYKKAPPAPAPAPAATAEPPEERAPPTVRSKASTITSDDAGEVPLRRAPKRKLTAIERTELALKERGWGQPSN
jgi:hypothetical protein